MLYVEGFRIRSRGKSSQKKIELPAHCTCTASCSTCSQHYFTVVVPIQPPHRCKPTGVLLFLSRLPAPRMASAAAARLRTTVAIEGIGDCYYRLYGFIDVAGEWMEDKPEWPANAEPVDLYVAASVFKIGRKNDAVTAKWESSDALLIDNPKVSRHHATITLKDGVFSLLCLSKNGCDVNGVSVPANQSAELTSGSRIRLGPLYIKFLLPKAQ